MLAGNVFAEVIGGDLSIYGDGDDNSIEVSLAPSGNIEVVGRGGTTVNGGSKPFVAFENSDEVPDDLRIDMNRGDNTVRILGLRVVDDVLVHAGSGDDTISVIGTTIGDTLRIFSGRGDDTVKVGGALRELRPSVGHIYVSSGSGNDLVGLANLDTARDVTLRSGRGSDSVGLSNVNIGDDLLVSTSRGNDTVGITDTIVADRTTLYAGSGNDSVAVRDSFHHGRVIISASFGRDFVSVTDTEIYGNARVYTGLGNDTFGAAGSSFRGDTYVSGGWGNDRVDASDGNTFERTPTVRRFEAEGINDLRNSVDEVFSNLEQSDILAPRFATIAELVAVTPDFQTLRAALEAAQLTEVLHSNGPFTVFAPTEDAFNALTPGTLDALLSDPLGQLSDILLYHVAAGESPAEVVVTLDSVPTVFGPPITVQVVDGGVVLNGTVNVIITDVFTANGVVHVIDAVLLPPS